MGGLESLVVLQPYLSENEVEITIEGVPDKPGVAARIFKAVADKGVPVNLIVQGVSRDGKSKITFTVPKKFGTTTRAVVDGVGKELGAERVFVNENIAIVSVEGIGMKSYQGVASSVFKALADAGINIDLISTSEIKISVVVDKSEGKKAVEVINKAFESSEVEIGSK